jgi:hypothetical protein
VLHCSLDNHRECQDPEDQVLLVPLIETTDSARDCLYAVDVASCLQSNGTYNKVAILRMFHQSAVSLGARGGQGCQMEQGQASLFATGRWEILN